MAETGTGNEVNSGAQVGQAGAQVGQAVLERKTMRSNSGAQVGQAGAQVGQAVLGRMTMRSNSGAQVGQAGAQVGQAVLGRMTMRSKIAPKVRTESPVDQGRTQLDSSHLEDGMDGSLDMSQPESCGFNNDQGHGAYSSGQDQGNPEGGSADKGNNSPRVPDLLEDIRLNWRQHVLVGIIAVLVSIFAVYMTSPSQSSDLRKMWKKVENINEDVATANAVVKGLRTDIRKYTDVIGRMDEHVKSVKNDVAFKSKKLEGLQKDFTSSEEQTTTKLKEFKQDLNEKLEAMNSEYAKFKETVNAIQNEVKDTAQSLKEKIKSDTNELDRQLQEKLKDFSEKITDIGDKFESMENDVEHEIKTLRSNLNSASDLIQKAEETKLALAEEVKSMDDIVELLRVNAFNKGAMLAVVLFLVVAVFALTIAVWTICRRLPSSSHSNGTGQGTGIFGGRTTPLW